jgi:hypothetical protein
MSYIKNRLREPSTFTGLGLIVTAVWLWVSGDRATALSTLAEALVALFGLAAAALPSPGSPDSPVTKQLQREAEDWTQEPKG